MKNRTAIWMVAVLSGAGFILDSSAHPQSTASPIRRIELKAARPFRLQIPGSLWRRLALYAAILRGTFICGQSPTK